MGTLAYSGILWHTLAYSGIVWHIFIQQEFRALHQSTLMDLGMGILPGYDLVRDICGSNPPPHKRTNSFTSIQMLLGNILHTRFTIYPLSTAIFRCRGTNITSRRLNLPNTT